MLHKKSEPLRLNSYKIDTQSLQNSLRELNEMKQQMQTTLSQYKSHQEQLMTENQRLKQEIQILQNKAEVKVDLSSYQSKILKLEAELKQQKKQTDKLKKLHETEKKSNQELIKKYESRLQNQISQSKIVVQKYQQRITTLSNQLKQAKNAIEISKIEKVSRNESLMDSRATNKTSEPKKKLTDSQSQYRPITEKERLFQSQKQLSKNGQANNMPPKSPVSNRDMKSNRELYEKDKISPYQNYAASYLPSEEDEQIFSATIRKLYYEVKEMGLSANQMNVLPQFKKMVANKNPTRKDIINFFKNPPIEQKNQQNLQKDATFLQAQIRKKYGKISGNYVIEVIIARVQQYENSSKLNTEDLQISNMTPSLSKENSSYEKFSNKSEHIYQKPGQYINASRPSINDNLKIESETSMF